MAVPEGCPLDIDPVEIGKLIAQVESLSNQIEESNRRLRAVEAQMEGAEEWDWEFYSPP